VNTCSPSSTHKPITAHATLHLLPIVLTKPNKSLNERNEYPKSGIWKFWEPLTKIYIPESDCGQIAVGEYDLHALQFGVISFKFIALGISLALSKYWTLSPWDACQAMWQWNNHAPGLSVLNATVNQPKAGSMATSRRRGLLSCSPAWSLAVNGRGALVKGLTSAGDCPRTRKSWPFQKLELYLYIFRKYIRAGAWDAICLSAQLMQDSKNVRTGMGERFWITQTLHCIVFSKVFCRGVDMFLRLPH